MNGDTAGLESTDSSGSDDTQRWRRALTRFNEAAVSACEIGEWQLQRLAEDAAARALSEVRRLEDQQALQLRRMDGEDSQAARQKEEVDGAVPA